MPPFFAFFVSKILFLMLLFCTFVIFLHKKSKILRTFGHFLFPICCIFVWSRTPPFWRCVGKVGHTEEGVSVCNAFCWILNQIYLSIYCQPPFHFVFVAKFRGWNWKIGQYRRGEKSDQRWARHIFKHLVGLSRNVHKLLGREQTNCLLHKFGHKLISL